MADFTPASIGVIGLDSESVVSTLWEKPNSTLPVVCVGGDHPYAQWYGTNGKDGLAGMYLDLGIRPYVAINTNDPTGEYPGGSGRMTWNQIKTIVANGVEPVNHGARHFSSWMRCTSGITLRYNGAATDASMTISSAYLLTTTCTGAAGDNVSFDLTSGTYNTLQKVVDAFNNFAGGVYQAALAPELLGTENSQNLAMITGVGIRGAVADSGNTQTAWSAGQVVAVGAVRRAVTDNGYYFVCTGNGTTGGGEPAWVKQIGATTADNTATWTCRYAEAQMQSSSDAIVGFKGWNISASSGIVIQYIAASGGTDRKTALVGISSNTLTLTEDGVRTNSFSLTNASFDTLTELVAAINALSPANWFAKLCDNTYYDAGTFGVTNASPAVNNYCGGGELSRCLKDCAVIDVTNTWVRFETGLSQWYVSERNVQLAHDTAATNGVTLKAFAQSGGEFYPWLVAGHQLYNSWRGSTFTRSAIFPMQVRLTNVKTSNGWFPHQDVADGTGVSLSAAAMTSWIDAAIDSGPNLLYLLSHWIVPDNTSPYNMNPRPTGTGFGATETIWYTFLRYIKTKVDAGLMLTCTPSEIPDLVARASEPINMVFNPKFRNSGNSIASQTSDSTDVAGWLVRTSTTPTISIANNKLTLTAIGSSQTPVSQDMLFVPGETYEIGALIEFDNTAVTNGVRFQVQPRRGGSSNAPRVRDLDPGASNAIVSPYVSKSGFMRFRFTWPKAPNYQRSYVRSINVQPYDLSVNKNVVVNYTNIGATADIDCSAGAVSALAVTAKEVAAAINAAVAGTAAYAARSEYHTAARAENGRVILESPYRANPGSTFWTRVTAGSSASALATIFGIGSGLTCQGEPMMAVYEDVENAAAFLYFDVNTTAGGVVTISNPYCIRVGNY